MQAVVGVLMGLSAVFLILLVLIQRGRGGGLAGALGGMGGHSAFGTKAGDKIMWFTVYLAGGWLLLCILAVKVVGPGTSAFSSNVGSNAPVEPSAADTKAPSGDDAAPSDGSGKSAGSAKSTDKTPPEKSGEIQESTEKDAAAPPDAGAKGSAPGDSTSKSETKAEADDAAPTSGKDSAKSP